MIQHPEAIINARLAGKDGLHTLTISDGRFVSLVAQQQTLAAGART